MGLASPRRLVYCMLLRDRRRFHAACRARGRVYVYGCCGELALREGLSAPHDYRAPVST